MDLAGGRRHFGASSPRDGIRHEVLRSLPHSATDISLAGGKHHFEPGLSPARCKSTTSIIASPEQQAALTPQELQAASGSLSNRRHYSPAEVRSRSVSQEPRQSETCQDLQLLDHRQTLGRCVSGRGSLRFKQPDVVRRRSEGGRARSFSPSADGAESNPTMGLAHRGLSTRRSLGSLRKAQATSTDEQQQQQQQQDEPVQRNQHLGHRQNTRRSLGSRGSLSVAKMLMVLLHRLLMLLLLLLLFVSAVGLHLAR